MLGPDGKPELVDTSPALRWVGTGRTIVDNKGNPVEHRINKRGK